MDNLNINNNLTTVLTFLIMNTVKVNKNYPWDRAFSSHMTFKGHYLVGIVFCDGVYAFSFLEDA